MGCSLHAVSYRTYARGNEQLTGNLPRPTCCGGIAGRVGGAVRNETMRGKGGVMASRNSRKYREKRVSTQARRREYSRSAGHRPKETSTICEARTIPASSRGCSTMLKAVKASRDDAEHSLPIAFGTMADTKERNCPEDSTEDRIR